MFETWNVTIPALTGAARRKAYIYVPERPPQAAVQRFPVLYMFDGHNLFFDWEATYGKSWGLLQYMERTQLPLIIAAVECNHGRNHERLKEYCPFACEMPDVGRVRGQGRETMEWLVHDFKPYVDRCYPTLSDWKHTLIGGSSMGGLMSLYAVTAYNHIFSRCAALSPSLWFAKDHMERMLTPQHVRRGTVVYMDYGERELERRDMAGAFGRAAALLMGRGVLVTSRIVPDGEHNEASWEKQTPFFMNTLLYELN